MEPIGSVRGAYKFSATKRNAYLANLRSGMRRGKAAEAVGLTRAIVCMHAQSDPVFRAEVDQAEMDACEHVEAALYLKALEGHFQSCIFWLMNRSQGRWQDKRVAVQITNVTPENIDVLQDQLMKKLNELEK